MNSDSPQHQPNSPAAPVAKKVPYVRSFHGRDFADDYEWLREKENPEVQQLLREENEYTSARTTHLKPLEKAIFSEVKARPRDR